MRSLSVALAAACACLTVAVATAGAAAPSGAPILPHDAVQVRDPGNPLGVPGPYNRNLLAGAPLYVDPNSPSAQAEAAYATSNPTWAGLLGDIASEPGAHRFWMWGMGSDVKDQVAQYLAESQIQQPGTTVLLDTYTLVHGACGSTATPDVQSTYDNFIDQVAQGIGDFHAVFFLELDSLITAPCLTPAELAIREAELRYAVTALEADPHVLVYLDGGAADALPALEQAELLGASGVGQAQGFFLNSTHFDWTTTELAYGEQISKLLGGAHFIINTGENGRGPLKPADPLKDGNEVLCNPPGRGLGPLTVSKGIAQQTGYPNADGFLWFTNPGGSGGQCVPGAPPTGQFWPAYAVMLAQNWVNAVTGPQVPAVPDVTGTTSPLAFGRDRIGRSMLRDERVSYVNGVGAVIVGAATLSGPDAADFAVSTNGCMGRTLDQGQSCRLWIHFIPHRSGMLTATLTIAVAPPAVPIQLELTGVGVRPPHKRHRSPVRHGGRHG